MAYNFPIKINKGYQKPVASPYRFSKATLNGSVYDMAVGLNQVAQISRDLEELKKEAEALIQKVKENSADEDTVLLDEIDELKKEVENIKKAMPEDAKVERIAMKLAIKLADIEKGNDGRDGIDGAPGKDAPEVDEAQIENRVLAKIKLPTIDEEKIVKKVLKLIPKPKDGKDSEINEEKLLKEILTKFESGKVKISTKHIDGFENSQTVLRNFIARGSLHGGQGSWKQKVLSGTINGINTAFTFSGEKPAEYSERVFLNYIEQNPFTDYTISGNTITYTVAPDASLSGYPHIIRYM